MVRGLLNAHTGRGDKVVRDHAERDAVIASYHSAVHGAGEIVTG